MFDKISEIAKAWIVAANPNPLQKELAEKRYTLCKGCEHFGQSHPILGYEYCKPCGCPISKKIFSQELDACPEHIWLEIEKPYFKSKKSLV